MKLGRLTTLGIAIVLFGVVAAFAPSVVLATEDACASEGAVPDPDNNPGLVSDCAALLAARDTLAGAATLDWAAETPIAEWDGVIPRGTPLRVTMLLLQERQLTGEIPTELGSLSNLQGLSLWGNQLTGEIPTGLGGLSNLQGLWLQGNQLTGEIPPELGSLANLQGLSLWDNQLTGEIPPELGGLSNLERLSLSNNQLTGVLPEGLTGLSALETFNFHNNPGLCAPVDEAFQAWLRSIASAIGSSCATVDSVEDRAVLVELHGSMDGEKWTANTNWLSDRPIREWHGVTIDASGRVNGLVLFRNGLTGEIPTELGNLSNLTGLYLGENQLTGEIPTELGNLSNLTRLYLDGNSGLSGPLPGSFTSLTSLTHLDLSGTGLCAPTDASFQAWLEDIAIRLGVVNCVSSEDPLIDRYDANNNDEIERSEVFAAINDYLDGGAGAPTRADVFKLIELYLGD